MDSLKEMPGATVDDKMLQTGNADPMAPASTVLDELEPTWEYKSVLLKDTADINAYGADGWNLVAVSPRPGDMAVFQFKRRRRT